MNTKKLILEGNLENINYRIKMANEDIQALEKTKALIEKDLSNLPREYDILYGKTEEFAYMLGVPNHSGTYTFILTHNTCGTDQIGRIVNMKAATTMGRNDVMGMINRLQAWLDKTK